MHNQNRHLAAILFTDIVGYTALMQQNEMHAVAMVKQYLSVLKITVKNHSGEILNDYGDGSLCSFSSATEALSCALELQQQFQKEPTVPLRIGLHIGEIFFEEKKVFGDGVNVASRIQSLGQANTILISGEINNKIKNNPGFRTVSLGHFEFKNVDDPVEVFALTNEGLIIPKKEEMTGKLKAAQKKFSAKKIMALAGIVLLLIIAAFAYKKFSGKKDISGKQKTIAVLPFKNISANKEENEPFCIGVALELQKKLEWMGELITIAPQSVEQFRDTKLSIADIAGALGGIKYILQGTVQRDKNKVKVFASLVDAEDGETLWSDDFPGNMEDIFLLQENIAQQIASALQVKITPDEQSRISRTATKSTAAIDAYNEALSSYVQLASAVHPLYWDSLSSNPHLYSEYQKTLALCNQVIKIDASMAEAYVLKGQTYFYSIYNWHASREYVSRIIDSIMFCGNKAVQINKASADGYVLLSRCFNWKDKNDSALTYLQKALLINPNNFDVAWQLGIYYNNIIKDQEKAIWFFKKAIRLNPLSVWTPTVYNELAFAYHSIGYFEKAELYHKKAILLSNNSMITTEATRALAIDYLHWGKGDSVLKYAGQYLKQDTNALYEMAEAYCNLKNDCTKGAQLYEQLWNRYHNHFNQHRWAVALINIGKKEEAMQKLNSAITQYINRNDTLSYDYAGIFALKGDKMKAMEILRKFDWGWGSPYLVQHDKLFDNIRKDKEFKDILQKALDEKTKLREKIRKMEENGEL